MGVSHVALRSKVLPRKGRTPCVNRADAAQSSPAFAHNCVGPFALSSSVLEDRDGARWV